MLNIIRNIWDWIKMLNNELNILVRKAYKNNLLSMLVCELAPLIR
jgi:hypothetical protein